MFLSFLYQYRQYLVLGVYVLISVAFMIAKSDRVNVNLKSAAISLISPLQKVVNNVSEASENFWNSIEELKKVKKELVRSREELEKLKGANIEIEELKKENERLKFTLENQKKIEFQTAYAEIIAKDPSNYYSSFIINKGKSQGIKINMPVIAYQGNQKGLVGKIIEVSAGSSKVLPVTGVGSFVGAMMADLRYTGIIKGMGKTSDHVVLEYINKDATINFGDLVVTSGQGGIFPKGIKIGIVLGFQKVKYGLFYKDIKVKPIIDFSQLEDVYVIFKQSEETFYQEGD
ncbi:MAG: rod shape-determining protein MreC [Spirochaetes bacterium]|nr:rod shape-determining protein MreC [Spirochaetota bacterium]